MVKGLEVLWRGHTSTLAKMSPPVRFAYGHQHLVLLTGPAPNFCRAYDCEHLVARFGESLDSKIPLDSALFSGILRSSDLAKFATQSAKKQKKTISDQYINCDRLAVPVGTA